ncbi:hypothetical protein GCM10010329_24290 [Streptomyces spiroverticillatus]|uniref:Excalibur calcium-binding domain-containing protein n=1 Tax=Streptomyces finlayi TaxID=67296 RepID=A0A919C8Q9_9ACTN|nr:excalibur calcium-binding domain-containing protein [Streptomyces finlayi]GHA01705.1 hypothetical protein GCM10010329_24290 [Streptomyces spiroverticillatus]GHC86040.1 hypothetical protein GCM10010334_16710 [Streptomyces finlayi]
MSTPTWNNPTNPYDGDRPAARRGKKKYALAGGGALLAFFVGIGVGGTGSDGDTPQARTVADVSPAPTVTVSATPPPAPTVTVTETATPTEPAPTVTVTATETETAAPAPAREPARQEAPAKSSGGGSAYYKNCTAVRNAGKAPLYVGDPGYSRKLDRDGDGVACEK